ncbi:hypothetical protein CEXT_70951 [Caerostris extrusa]|uniref:Uncharacterized protein n=1 Tax=Caerostris extrusa TaxID=172846 RepID=A0AAV4TVU4_CAEEX|nr:hypothetical protein CEXT_70951 [Caerostris extrusa]
MDSLYRRFGRSAVSARAPRDVPETTPLGRIPKISQVLKEQFLLTTWARKERQAAAAANILFPGSEVGEGFFIASFCLIFTACLENFSPNWNLTF